MEGFQEFQPFLGRHLQVDAVIDPPPRRIWKWRRFLCKRQPLYAPN